MSLINEALKRAKQAQQQAEPSSSPGLQFRPVEPAQHPGLRFDWIAPAVVAVVGLLALIFLWPWAQRSASSKLAASKAQSVVAAKEVSVANPAAPASVPAVSAPQASAALQPAPVTVAPKTSPSTEATPSPPVNEANSVTTAVANSEPPPQPKPAPLKLQAIVYNPNRPSAMINGRTLFIGDKFGEFHIIAINKESATLAGSSQTNVLTLSE